MRRLNHRPGVSLLEVLVAIFIVAIGLLALLTLFPLGALRMGQALKDDRTSQLARSADGYLRAHWRGSVAAQFKRLDNSDPNDPGNPDPFVWAMDDPNLLLKMKSKPGDLAHKGPPYWENHYPPALFSRPSGVTIPQAPPAYISPLTLVSDVWVGAANDTPPLTSAMLADASGHGHYVTAGTPTPGVASYPVMVDPLGYLARQNFPDQKWVGGPDATAGFIPLPRRTLATTTAAYVNPYTAPAGLLGRSQAFENFCLTDDFTFRLNGGAGDPTTGQPVRQGRYSCAAIVQRLDNAARDRATLKVMVFDARPPGLATPDDEVVLHGVTAAQGFQPGSRAVTLSVKTRGVDQTPLIRKGGWIMDGTIDPSFGVRSANFYRIVGVTEGPDLANAANTLYVLDLEKEITGPISPGGASVYLFAGLAEVFERPMLVPDQD